jgi:hypothetical protein
MNDNTTAFTIMDDPRPGLVEGACSFCGWQPFTAGQPEWIIELLAKHVARDHLGWAVDV